MASPEFAAKWRVIDLGYAVEPLTELVMMTRAPNYSTRAAASMALHELEPEVMLALGDLLGSERCRPGARRFTKSAEGGAGASGRVRALGSVPAALRRREPTCANAHQRLLRARQQLRHFLTGRCGLLDERGSCRCARKTRGFIQQGIVDPARLRSSPIHLDRARKASTEGVRVLQGCVEQAYAELLRGQPLTESVDFAAILRTVLEQGDVRRALDLEN